MVKKNRLVKVLLIGAGSLSVMIGVAGIILPVLPTTPFLLLAAMCYMRSSERLYKALVQNRVFGNYIRNYVEGRGITVKAKILTLILFGMVLGATMILSTESWTVRIILAVVLVGVTLHIMLIRSPENNRLKTAIKQESFSKS